MKWEDAIKIALTRVRHTGDRYVVLAHDRRPFPEWCWHAMRKGSMAKETFRQERPWD